jgi:hypothetical protein
MINVADTTVVFHASATTVYGATVSVFYHSVCQYLISFIGLKIHRSIGRLRFFSIFVVDSRYWLVKGISLEGAVKLFSFSLVNK